MGELYQKYGYGKEFNYYNPRSNPWAEPDIWEYLGVEWEAYGDRHYWKNKETNEVWTQYVSIGD